MDYGFVFDSLLMIYLIHHDEAENVYLIRHDEAENILPYINNSFSIHFSQTQKTIKM